MLRVALIGTMCLAFAVNARRSDADDLSGLAAAAAIQDAFVKAIESAEKSVVSVGRDRVQNTPRGRRDAFGIRVPEPRAGIEDPNYIPNEFGAGIVIDANGLILTNYHLVRGGPVHGKVGEGQPEPRGEQVLYVRLSDRRGFEARIYAADPRSDLAVLKIAASDLTPIRLGNATHCRKGQFVIALGNPYAIARDGSASATWGIISNLYRSVPQDVDISESAARRKETIQNLGVLLQVDTRLELGTSGGALLNLQGELIGITTPLAAIVGYEKSAGLALPIDDSTRRIIETLRQGMEVEYGFLGIEIDHRDVLPTEFSGELAGLAARYRQFGAARINRVFDKLPAQQSGLQGGDLVLRVGDRPIFGKTDLQREVGMLAPGSRVPLRIWRPTLGREIERGVEVGKWPVVDEEGMIVSNRLRPPWRGLVWDYPTARSSMFKSSSPDRSDRHAGVLVLEVLPDSQAAHADMHPEDLITHVQNRSVRTPQEFAEAVRNETGPVKLRVISASAVHPMPHDVEIKGP